LIRPEIDPSTSATIGRQMFCREQGATMDPREFSHATLAAGTGEAGAQPEYRINVTVAVNDIAQLWSAAAARAMTAPGMRIEDVLDTIGPREAPSVRDCLAMLAVPGAIPGCRVDDFWIDSMPGLPTRAELSRNAAVECWVGRVPTPLTG
jgi:hypothetical protein